MNQFTTIYNKSRDYCKATFIKDGSYTATKIKDDSAFQRHVYQAFQNELNSSLQLDPYNNAWIFDQNELKTIHTGRQTTKEMCRTLYFNAEAIGFLIRTK